MTVIEICVDTLAGVGTARRAGADRVELCRDLWCGGLTPPDELIAAALGVCPAGGLQVIVRSRPGDFVYTPDEVEGMCADIQRIAALFSRASVPCGFVVGALTRGDTIDEEAAARFRAAAGTRRLTFHRAFDAIAHKPAALETLVELGYQRVLTTGGMSAVADTGGLAALARQGAGRIALIASGGLRSGNIAQVLRESLAPEVHMRAPLPAPSAPAPLASRDESAAPAGAHAEHPLLPQGTDAQEVARIVRAVRGVGGP